MDNHIKEFNIQNFKCLDTFEMNNIGQFNLIAGNNDVGKTTLLEALLLNNNLNEIIHGLNSSFASRNNINDTITKEFDICNTYFNNKRKSKTINYKIQLSSAERSTEYSITSAEIAELNEEEKLKVASNYLPNQNLKYVLVHKKDNTLLDVRFTLANPSIKYLPYVWNTASYGDDLVGFYADNIQGSKESKATFLDCLKIFIPDIEDIEVSTSLIPEKTTIFLRIKGVDPLVPLSMFGDCSIKLFRFLSEFKKVKNKYLLIDEIDTGIHYSRFKQFWKIILKSAKEDNVQLFATTHSLECLKFFKEALEDADMKEFQKDARHFLIRKTDNGQIKSSVYDFDQFEHAINVGNEIRK